MVGGAATSVLRRWSGKEVDLDAVHRVDFSFSVGGIECKYVIGVLKKKALVGYARLPLSMMNGRTSGRSGKVSRWGANESHLLVKVIHICLPPKNEVALSRHPRHVDAGRRKINSDCKFWRTLVLLAWPLLLITRDSWR